MTLEDLARLPAKQKVLGCAFAACFVIECASNGLFGFRSAGGWRAMPVSLLLAAATGAIAVIGAYLAVERNSYSWWQVRKWSMTAMLAACFAFSVVSGLRLVGITLADGALQRERQATQGTVATETLDGKRQARKDLGTPRDPEQVKAEIGKLLGQYIGKAKQTVGAATKDCADPGWAPGVCKRVGDLRVQLADAERAVKLDAEIVAAADKAGKAPVVAAGDPDLQAVTSVVRVFAAAWTLDDTRFWLPVCIVLLMTTLATFGLSWSGILDDDEEATPKPRPQPQPLPDDYYRHLPGYRPAGLALPPPGYHGPDGHGPSGGPSGGPHGAPHGAPHGGGERTFRDPAREDLRAPAAPSATYDAPAYQGPAYHGPAYHGAPINITVSSPQASSAPSVLPAGVGVSNPAAAVPPPAPAAAAGPHVMLARAPRHDLAALPADVPPVDRSKVIALLGEGAQAAIDVALTFRAACVLDAPGSMLGLDDLYRRYRAYVGERAVSAVAFEALAPAVSIPVVRIGEAAHATGVALRPAVAKVG